MGLLDRWCCVGWFGVTESKDRAGFNEASARHVLDSQMTCRARNNPGVVRVVKSTRKLAKGAFHE